MDGWREREARRRADVRERNEWIEDANEQLGSNAEMDDYACECGDATCQAKVALTIAEYESVRADGAQFVVAVNQEDPEVEAVVEETDRFVVARVVSGSLAHIAHESDPRY
jgi:hypothetical protein